MAPVLCLIPDADPSSRYGADSINSSSPLILPARAMFDRHQYYLNHREEELAANRRYRKAHKGELREYGHRWYLQHREETLRAAKKWKLDHIGHMRVYWKEYGEAHREEKYRARKEKHLQLKRRVFGHYSPELKCTRCGFSDLRALSIDHVAGGGMRHRRMINPTRPLTVNFYEWLEAKGYPSGYQVLCMNCQFIKRDEKEEGRARFEVAEVVN